MSNLTSNSRKFHLAIALSILITVLKSAHAGAEPSNLNDHVQMSSNTETLLAGSYSEHPQTFAASSPQKKHRKKLYDEPGSERADKVRGDLDSSPSLTKKIVARGGLGFYMGGGASALIFEGSATKPLSKTSALDGGLDYTKWGSTLVSVTLLRIGGGGAYVYEVSRTTVARFGGRAGLAQVRVAINLPDFTGEGSSSTYATSYSFLYGEARAGIETKMGGLLVGGEVQLPLFYAGTAVGASLSGLAIYGTIGVPF